MKQASSIMRVLKQWWDGDHYGTNTLFEIHVRSTVPVQPGAVLIIDTLEITDGVVIAVAYPRDPQVEDCIEEQYKAAEEELRQTRKTQPALRTVDPMRTGRAPADTSR